MIRTIWAWMNAFAATMFCGPLVIVSALLGVRGGVYDWASRAWSAWILWGSGTRVHVEGLQNVKIDRPQVFVSNHQSWYDVFAIAVAIPKRYRFIAKKELASIPVFGQAWRAAGHISIDRSNRNSAIRSLDRAGEIIREDKSSIVIFPEGTRSPDGRLRPFKKGAFMLALHAGVDIVPIAVRGTREVMPKGAWRVRSGVITVAFGEPVHTAEYSSVDRDELITEVEERVRALLTGERRPIAYAA